MAPWALFNGYRWSSPMSQHFRFDASRSLTALEQDSTIVAVIEMSQTKWLVAALVPGVERQPLKKFDAQEEMLLKLLHRWHCEAGQAGRNIKRIVVAFEAGRDGFWLARWLRARGVARTPARKDRSSRYGTSDARFSRLAAWRKAPLQHGGNPDDRGGGREATEP